MITKVEHCLHMHSDHHDSWPPENPTINNKQVGNVDPRSSLRTAAIMWKVSLRAWCSPLKVRHSRQGGELQQCEICEQKNE
jgi:hypothetical protein